MTEHYLSQSTEISLIQRLAPYLTNRTFIDIGAEKGMFARVMLELDMNGVLFEPMPRHHDTLQKLVDTYAGTTLHAYAITNVDGRQNFHVATDSNGTELDYYHSLQQAVEPGIFAHSRSFEVECRSLQSLVQTGEISSDIGVLKTDTEGNDLNVLRGLGSLCPEVVICEYFSNGLYSDWPEGDPELIIEHMRRLGYRTFLITKRIVGMDLEFIEVNSTSYLEKQWGNLFFFREDFYGKSAFTVAQCVGDNHREIADRFRIVTQECSERLAAIHLLDAEVQRLRTMQLKDSIVKQMMKRLKSWVQ